jgi:tetratricopeptide (TPR) repeat protein
VAASKRPADPAATFDAGAPLRKLGDAARLQQAGQLDAAEAAYAALLRDHPDDTTALINGGVLALSRGDAAAAIDRLARAARLVPRNAIARNNLGFARLHAGDDPRALADFDEAVRLQPTYAQAHNNRGIALVRLGRDADARAAFARALALDDKALDAALNLADLEARLGRADEARVAFDRALAIDPQSIAARAGRAFADALAGNLEASLASLDALVAERPDAHGAWKTLGAVANWSWEHDAAERAFRAAHARKPDDDEAAFGIASTLLARGRYAEGFVAFERRREGSASAATRFAALPAWDGRPTSGTLLLYAEQGLGDVVQFARFIAAARARAGAVVLLLDGYWRSLAPLLARAAAWIASWNPPRRSANTPSRRARRCFRCRTCCRRRPTRHPPAATCRHRPIDAPHGPIACATSRIRAWASRGRSSRAPTTATSRSTSRCRRAPWRRSSPCPACAS